jgi:murein DD-endopeptidase MepM/ murein hydrolase activator NlpD
LLSLIGVIFSEYSGDERLAALKTENKIIKQQITDFNQRLKNADEQMQLLIKKDTELRLVSNLPSVESILNDAGIGGSDAQFQYNPDLISEHSDELIQSNTKQLEELESKVKLELQSFAELTTVIQSNIDKLNYIPSICPTRSGRITDRFGTRRGFRSWKPHTGIDIASRWGTPIYVTADGVVETTAWRSGYGKCIIVNHGNGIKTLYGHLSAYKVKKGQPVKRNQLIAKMGSTGLSTGPHLHYEVRVNDVVINPELYIFFDMIDQLVLK